MINHGPIILRAALYFLAIVCVNFGKEFVDVGAAKLLAYTWGDWLVLATPTTGNCLIALMAFFDKSFAEHMANAPKSLSAADFKSLMEDWATNKGKESTSPKSTVTP